MVLGTGLGSQLSFAKETTYGTAVTCDHFLPADKVSMKLEQVVAQGGGFQGQLFQLGSRRVITTKNGKGTIETQILNKGMGLFFQNLMGTSVTPVVIGATTAYTQTHTFAIGTGKMLTIQSSVPSTDGTANPYTFKGCKFPAAEITYEVDKSLNVKWDVDAREVSEAIAVPAASYDSALRQFVGTDVAITVGTYGASAPATAAPGVSKVSIKIERPMKTDRYYLSASGLKAEPLQNDFAKITGTITADFVDKTLWADKFVSGSGFSLLLSAVGSQIGATGSYDTFKILLPCVFIDGDTPTVEGADVVSGDFPFTVLFDGTNTPVITIISAESSL